MILVDPENLEKLKAALGDLRARCIAVPPFETGYLERGHAVHFRCGDPEAEGMRVDFMATMRGVDRFPQLWERRTTITLEDGLEIEVLALPDLVQAKKTQRDKDWPMIRRLLEANYFAHRTNPSPERVRFWFRELRTPELLIELVQRFPDEAGGEVRPAVRAATQGDLGAVSQALSEEEAQERERDAEYWQPLREELSRLR
ncbi:MAG: hypothetical protein GWO24_24130, partial [Akkermansiaceae bacterium]|nr:hypothetical protein [Akkermansiaceae bacterium]